VSALQPSPVRRELVPPPALVAPRGFAVLSEPLVTGLPHRVALTPALSLVVILPTGVVAAWRAAESEALVSSSDAQAASIAAAGSAEPALGAPPLRLLVETGGVVSACLPLVLARCCRAVSATGVDLELVALGWRLHAGTVRGAGDFGSRLDVAWREVGRGADVIAAPDGEEPSWLR
jgi:hypothetical protein